MSIKSKIRDAQIWVRMKNLSVNLNEEIREELAANHEGRTRHQTRYRGQITGKLNFSVAELLLMAAVLEITFEELIDPNFDLRTAEDRLLERRQAALAKKYGLVQVA